MTDLISSSTVLTSCHVLCGAMCTQRHSPDSPLPPLASPHRSFSSRVKRLTRRWKLSSCSIRVFCMNNRNIDEEETWGSCQVRFSLIQGDGHPQRMTVNCGLYFLWQRVTNTEIEYQLQLERGANAIFKPEKRSWADSHRLAKTYDLHDLAFIMICCTDGALLFLPEKNNLFLLLIDTSIQCKRRSHVGHTNLIGKAMLYIKLSSVALGVWDFLISTSPDPIMMKQQNKSLQLAPQETKGIEFE